MGSVLSLDAESGLGGTGDGGARGVHRMDARMERRLSRGVDANCKVLLRGARGSGKTTCLARLCGKKKKNTPGGCDAYDATAEIAVGHVHWRNSTTDEVVKVEAWDVVDVALRPQEAAELSSAPRLVDPDAPAGLPSAASVERWGGCRVAALDAATVDVWRGAHACILLYDPRSSDSWRHAARLAREAPADLPVLLLRNFRDAIAPSPRASSDSSSSSSSPVLDARVDAHSTPAAAAAATKSVAVVSDGEVQELMAWLRAQGGADRPVHHFETSMVDGHGLRLLYDFLNLPFLYLRRKHFLEQLRLCEERAAETNEALLLASRSQAYAPKPVSSLSTPSPHQSDVEAQNVKKQEGTQEGGERRDSESGELPVLQQEPLVAESGLVKPHPAKLKVTHHEPAPNKQAPSKSKSKRQPKGPSAGRTTGRTAGRETVASADPNSWLSGSMTALEDFLADGSSDDDDDALAAREHRSRAIVRQCLKS